MLVVQFVSENVLLTLIGGALALGGTLGILELLNRSELVPHAQFAMNPRIFFWGLVVTLSFGVLSGAWPAWRMSRLHPVEALKGGL
jgi:putative ABC transport system permease protein